MKVIKPKEMTSAVILACSIPALDINSPARDSDDPPEYVASTIYAAGTRCTVLSTVNTIYESLEDGNTGNYPPTDVLAETPKWAVVCPTNRWRALDDYINTRASAPDAASYTLDATRTSSVALFGLNASEVILELYTGADVLISSETIKLLDRNVTDWYSYFFSEFTNADRCFWDYPIGFGTKLKVTVNAPSGTVEIGKICHGLDRYIGKTLRDITRTFASYGTMETNSYGFTNVKKGFVAELTDSVILVDHVVSDAVNSYIKSILETPVVVIGDNSLTFRNSLQSLISYGVVKDISYIYQSGVQNSKDKMNFSFQGII